MSSKITSQEAINYEQQYSAHNYHPLPVVFSKAEGANVWDPEGKKYLDFLSAYSAVNQGHCHPKIIKALIDQAQNLTLSSRAFSNDVFGQYAKFVTNYFGYEMMLPMNTGAEAVETAMKLARKWGYLKKGIPQNEAIILAATNNFHGRTIAIISMSTDPEARDNYGPFLPKVGPYIPGTNKELRYNNIPDLEEALKNAGDKVCGFLIEPIQGEAGVVVPDKDYLQRVAALCKKYNVLFICDEIQTGVGRTGKLLCHEHSGVHPDVVLLGKAVAGGLYPVSLVLSSRDIMSVIKPGTHGSTFGGNPLGSAVSIAALEVVRDEKLTERAEVLGQRFRKGLEPLLKSGIVSQIRGMGLLNAIVIDSSKANGRTAWDLCLLLKDRGLLAKPTHDDIIRLSPPLVISEQDIDKGISIISKAVDDLSTYVAPKH